MIKLKNILSEGYAWEREEGKPLPTLADTTAAYARKLQEADEDPKPDYIDADNDGDETESMKKAFADKEKSTSYKTQVLWDNDMKELQKDIKKIKQQHANVEVSAVTRKNPGYEVTVKIFQDDTNESALITKSGLQEMREIPLEDRILRNLKGNDYILRETFKK